MGFGKDGKGAILYDRVADGAVGALAARDVVLLNGSYSSALLEDFRIIKMDYWLSVTPSQAVTLINGPMLIGLADSRYSAAEIEECIESTVLNRGNTDEELAMRAVWPLEMINVPDADAGDISDLVRKGSVNIRWTFTNPNGWKWWVYNASAGAFASGNLLQVQSKIFGVWVS